MPVVTAGLEAISEYQEAKRLQEEKKEAARIKAQKKQQKEDKAQFKAWIETGAGHFPSSFRVYGQDQITIKDDEIVTSQGATCPLDHAVKALRFYQALNGKDWTKNGHRLPVGCFEIDSIINGEVKAGCHTFTAKEIQRFINQWREVLGL
jgi:hypothetical protein